MQNSLADLFLDMSAPACFASGGPCDVGRGELSVIKSGAPLERRGVASYKTG